MIKEGGEGVKEGREGGREVGKERGKEGDFSHESKSVKI